MEKALQRIKTIAVIVVIILLTALSILGFSSREKGIWTSKLPNYTLGMDFNGLREIRFTLSTNEVEEKVYVDEAGNIKGKLSNGSETKESANSQQSLELTQTQGPEAQPAEQTATDKVEGVDYKVETRTIKDNEDESINIYNFNRVKQIVQKRLENRNNYEYNLRMDNVTGDIIVELPDTEDIGILESLVTTRGKIQIIDYQTGVVLLDNSDIKKVTATYNTTEQYAYQGYMQIHFNKEGTEKLREISKQYNKTQDAEGKDQYKYVSIMVEDQVMRSTYFGDELTNGILNIPMGDATTDTTEFQEVMKSLTDLVTIVNSDTLPLKYQVTSDDYIMSSITDTHKLIAACVALVAMLVVSIILIVKYKVRGLKAAIIAVGYAAIIALTLRYTKVYITINSLLAAVGNMIIFYAFLFMLLKELKSNYSIKAAYVEVIKKLYIAIIPVCIILVIFTFMDAVIINSIGMTLFWGIFTQLLYSVIVIYLLRVI